MTGPFVVVFATQSEFTTLAGVIAALGERCCTLQVTRPDSSRRSRGFFDGNRLVEPNLQIESAGPGAESGDTVQRLSAALKQMRASAVLVLGDTDGAALGTKAAAAAGVPVGRLDDEGFADPTLHPTQAAANRAVVLERASVHFVPSEFGAFRLRDAGIPPERIVGVGSLVAETTRRLLPSPEERAEVLAAAGLSGDHIVAAVSDPANVDDPDRLRFILHGLARQDLPVAMPLGPRVQQRIKDFDLTDEVRGLTNLHPVDRPTFLTFVESARLVVTDVEAVLWEAATLGVPALRVGVHDPAADETAWIPDERFALRVPPNHLLSAHVRTALADPTWAERLGRLPDPGGDGRAGQRIAVGMFDLAVTEPPPQQSRPKNSLLNAGTGP